MNWDIKEIGTFTLNSGTMRISDPCYDKTVWCSGTIPNCVIGEWQAGAAYYNDAMFGRRVALLVAKAANSSVGFDLANDIYALTPAPFEVGVDSGQAGMYDDVSYGLDSTVEDLPEPDEIFGDEPGCLWYSVCCSVTDGDDYAGVIPTGVVSCSGFGDGSYTAFYHKDGNGKTNLIAILYIDPSLESQEDDVGEEEAALIAILHIDPDQEDEEVGE